MKKKIFLSLLFFAAGFFTHALVFPDLFTNGITDISKVVLPNPTPATAQKNEPLITKVSFDGQQFSRHNVTVQFSRYIAITNTSATKQMWLTSNNPLFVTDRGYSESETMQVQMEKRGQFIVADKNNPSERLVVTVK